MRKFAFLLFFIWYCISGYSQNNDFGLWTEVCINKDLNKRFEATFAIANRQKENATMRDKTFSELGIEFSKKWFSTGLVYRLSNEKDQEVGYEIGHRFTYFVGLNAKVQRFKFSLTNKLQTQYQSIYSSENGKVPKIDYRNRGKVNYNIKGLPLKPYAYYEFYLSLKGNNSQEFEKNRISLGVDYKINKRSVFGLGYICQYEYGRFNFEKKHIISLEYCFEL